MSLYFEPGEGGEDSLDKCTPRPGLLINRESYLGSIMYYREVVVESLGFWDMPNGKRVPFHELGTHCCMHNLSCRPLHPGESLSLGDGHVFEDPLLVAAGSSGT